MSELYETKAGVKLEKLNTKRCGDLFFDMNGNVVYGVDESMLIKIPDMDIGCDFPFSKSKRDRPEGVPGNKQMEGVSSNKQNNIINDTEGMFSIEREDKRSSISLYRIDNENIKMKWVGADMDKELKTTIYRQNKITKELEKDLELEYWITEDGYAIPIEEAEEMNWNNETLDRAED